MSPNNYTASYYFNAREEGKGKVSRLLRSLLLQLCLTERELPPKVEDLRKERSSRDTLDERLFVALEERFSRQEGDTYVVIDALDECDTSCRSGEESEVEKLAKVILWLVNTRTSNLHILVTSRHGGLASLVEKELNDTARRARENGLHYCMINLQARGMKAKIDDDIEKLVEVELKRWNKRKGRLWLPLNEARQSVIANAVKGRADGM